MTAATATAAAAIAIPPAERELVQEELAALTASIRDPAALSRYAELARAIDGGELHGEQITELEGVLELTLGTGRARRLHGPESERLLLRLYQQTPRGAAIRQRTDDANRALGALVGQPLSGLAFTALGPGVYRLEISTDRCQLTVETDRLGLTVDSLGVEI
jgi:hypothetical protein